MNSILSLIRQAAEARYEKANVPAYCKLIAEAEKLMRAGKWTGFKRSRALQAALSGFRTGNTAEVNLAADLMEDAGLAS